MHAHPRRHAFGQSLQKPSRRIRRHRFSADDESATRAGAYPGKQSSPHPHLILTSASPDPHLILTTLTLPNPHPILPKSCRSCMPLRSQTTRIMSAWTSSLMTSTPNFWPHPRSGLRQSIRRRCAAMTSARPASYFGKPLSTRSCSRGSWEALGNEKR